MSARSSWCVLALAVPLAAGCGRVSFDLLTDGSGPGGDAAAADARGPDADGSGLLMHFGFSAGGLLHDDTRDLEGTCTACPSPTAGPRAGTPGALFAGTQCVHVPAKTLAPATFTIALWERQDSTPRRTLFGKPENGATSFEDSIEIGGGPGSSGLTVYSSGGAVGTAVPVGTWHHVAGRYDGTQLAIFVDGALANAHVELPQTYTDDDANLGCDIDTGTELGYFQGALADVRLYGRALDDLEIAQLAQP